MRSPYLCIRKSPASGSAPDTGSALPSEHSKHDHTMKTTLAFTVFIAGITLFSACKKEKPQGPATGTVVRITVHNERGEALGGVPVRVYDEKGYEKFKNDHTVQPLDRIITAENGEALYRMTATDPTNRTRFLSFVVLEMQDKENYRMWAVSRTIGREKETRIEIVIDAESSATDPQRVSADSTEPLPHIDLYDENNGRTLFGNALYLDAGQHFVGANRYSIVDAGTMDGPEALGALHFEGLATRISALPRHGYFICKDISMQKFPSGQWALSIAAEYVRAYISGQLHNGRVPVGVRMHYSLHRPEGHHLPEWGTLHEVSQSEGATLTLELADRNAAYEFAARKRGSLEFREAPGRVTIRVTDPKIARGKIYDFYIRAGAYYTEASIEITD